MKFRILGAERLTGEDVDMIIEAPTRGAVEAKAHRMNVLIERIEVLLKPPPAPTGHAPAQPGASDPSWAAALVVLLLVGAAVYWSHAGQGPEQSPA